MNGTTDEASLLREAHSELKALRVHLFNFDEAIAITLAGIAVETPDAALAGMVNALRSRGGRAIENWRVPLNTIGREIHPEPWHVRDGRRHWSGATLIHAMALRVVTELAARVSRDVFDPFAYAPVVDAERLEAEWPALAEAFHEGMRTTKDLLDDAEDYGEQELAQLGRELGARPLALAVRPDELFLEALTVDSSPIALLAEPLPQAEVDQVIGSFNESTVAAEYGVLVGPVRADEATAIQGVPHESMAPAGEDSQPDTDEQDATLANESKTAGRPPEDLNTSPRELLKRLLMETPIKKGQRAVVEEFLKHEDSDLAQSRGPQLLDIGAHKDLGWGREWEKRFDNTRVQLNRKLTAFAPTKHLEFARHDGRLILRLRRWKSGQNQGDFSTKSG